MSSSKRRKLNDPPDPPRKLWMSLKSLVTDFFLELSALAARRSFAAKQSKTSTPSGSNSNGSIVPTNKLFVPGVGPVVEDTVVRENQDARIEERALQSTEIESYATHKRSDTLAFDIDPISS